MYNLAGNMYVHTALTIHVSLVCRDALSEKDNKTE